MDLARDDESMVTVLGRRDSPYETRGLMGDVDI